MEQPQLRLGVMGFGQQQADAFAQWSARMPAGGPVWVMSNVDEADVWLICGSSVNVTNSGELMVSEPSDPAVQHVITRDNIVRPLAFAKPVPEGFESAECFDVSTEKQLKRCLQRFEAWLRPLRTQFELAALLAERVSEYKGSVVHVVRENKLIAVVDLVNWAIGIHPRTRPVDLATSEWIRRPPRAADIPSSFVRQPFHRLMWMYASRSDRDVLPGRYRQLQVHYRKAPAVPDDWLDDLHRIVLHALKDSPATFDVLQDMTLASREELTRCLGGLYFGGAITTNADHSFRNRHNAAPVRRRPSSGSNRGSSGVAGGRRSRPGLIGRALWATRRKPDVGSSTHLSTH
ncbi:hypothetical protein [Hydrogenophaga sp. 5NK40-0174]|uniref:hypothetical protein n=1 Tax=Hydrogenophaga sp. 5NK40-0174 TaxID=3127649 RepID=UPI003105EC1B